VLIIMGIISNCWKV